MVVYLLQKITKYLTQSDDLLKTINIRPNDPRGAKDTAELARLLYNYPTVNDFVKACYRYITNKDGDTALTLLSNYYKNNPQKFHDFIRLAASSARRLYLFDMLPSIFPNFMSPNTVLNGIRDDMFNALKNMKRSYVSDVLFLSRLVNIAAALKLAAEQHPLESRDIDELFEKVEGAIKACMVCTSMDVPANVTKILEFDADKGTASTIVHQALAFVSGPLELCIKHHLTGLLGATPLHFPTTLLTLPSGPTLRRSLLVQIYIYKYIYI